MAFYGFDNTQGVGAVDDNGYRIGTVFRFPKKAERDAWVNDNLFGEGEIHREAITCAQARREMARHVTGPTSKMSMDRLWNEYYAEVAE